MKYIIVLLTLFALTACFHRNTIESCMSEVEKRGNVSKEFLDKNPEAAIAVWYVCKEADFDPDVAMKITKALGDLQ